MFLVRLILSLGVAIAFGWLGLWLIGAAVYSERLPLAGMSLLVGAPAWAAVTHGVLKRVPAKRFRSDPML
jgi:hypothetical protein